MYRVYEYEATKTCPDCSEEETVPVTAFIDQRTGRQTVLARRVRCERHLSERRTECRLSGPIGPVVEIGMTDGDTYDYMAQKIREGFHISCIGR
jgi:hypothetical protein